MVEYLASVTVPSVVPPMKVPRVGSNGSSGVFLHLYVVLHLYLTRCVCSSPTTGAHLAFLVVKKKNVFPLPPISVRFGPTKEVSDFGSIALPKRSPKSKPNPIPTSGSFMYGPGLYCIYIFRFSGKGLIRCWYKSESVSAIVSDIADIFFVHLKRKLFGPMDEVKKNIYRNG